MIVAVSGVINEQELAAATAAGADSLGVKVGQNRCSASFILMSTAARIMKRAVPFKAVFVETELAEAEEIADIVRCSGITAVIIYSAMPVDDVKKLYELLPEYCKIQLGLDPRGLNIDEMKDYFPYIHGCVLDFSLIDEPLLLQELEVQADACKFFISSCVVPVSIAGLHDCAVLSDLATVLKPFAIIVDFKSIDDYAAAQQKTAAQVVRKIKKINSFVHER